MAEGDIQEIGGVGVPKGWIPWAIGGAAVLAFIYIYKKRQAAGSTAGNEILTGTSTIGTSPATGYVGSGLSATDFQTGLKNLQDVITGNQTNLGAGIQSLAKGIANSVGDIESQLTAFQSDLAGNLTTMQNAITSAIDTQNTNIQTDFSGFATNLANMESAIAGNIAPARDAAILNIGMQWQNACMHQWRESCAVLTTAYSQCGGESAAHNASPTALYCIGQNLITQANPPTTGGSGS